VDTAKTGPGGTTTYTLHNPNNLGLVLGKIDQTGKVIKGSSSLQYMVDQAIRGIATDKAKKIHCVPDIPKVKEKHVKILDQILLKQVATKSKKSGNRRNLKTITEKDRYKGKVDYEARRADIEKWVKEGLSLGVIASRLGITKSALSMANKRYKLYPKRIGSAETRRRAIIHKKDRKEGKLKCVFG